MSISMYEAAVPTMSHMLGNLSTIVGRAAEHAEARHIDPAALLGARLFPDMFPFVRQVQVATDQAKAGVARLAGIEIPRYPDNETSFEALQARIVRTIAFLDGIEARRFDGSEERRIALPVHDATLETTGRDYLFGRVLPNFYFHVATACAILRHNGVEIGKMDYLGGSE